MNEAVNARGAIFIPSPLLASFSEVAHGFFTRLGGVSAPPFASLNFDGREGDSAENLARNRGLASLALGADLGGLVTVNQVHGDGVHVAGRGASNAGERPDADAILTSERELPIGILTADCLPALLFDPVRKAVGAVHAGWRGTVKGVALKAIERMREEFGSEARDIVAALGPSIGPCCYKVGESVAREFISVFKDTPGVIMRGEDGIRADIALANRALLSRAGVKDENIRTAPFCTSCSSGKFFSYRKDGGRTGRQLSLIMLR